MNINTVMHHLDIFNNYGYDEETGGINRIAFRHAERLAALKFSMLCQEAGLEVHFDYFGNVIARRKGKDNSLPPVMLGSHIDTVKDGGRYDGLLGVVAALQVVQHLNEHQIETDHPIEIVAFTCEESSRFNKSTLGSKYLIGDLTKDDMKKLTDDRGKTLFHLVDTLKQSMPSDSDIYHKDDLKAYLELHIEQGPILQNKHKDIGIVTHIAAPHRYKLKLIGETSHSGSTPMPMRKDALTAASEIALKVESIAQAHHQEGIVATVGYIQPFPNMMNAIPGEVKMLIDVRGKESDSREKVASEIEKAIETITERRDIKVELEDLGSDTPVNLNPEIADITEDVCEGLGYSYRFMFSGAGHDAMNMALICPTSMIFIPCKDGISHSPKESVEVSEIEKGVNTLIGTTIELAKKDTAL